MTALNPPRSPVQVVFQHPNGWGIHFYTDAEDGYPENALVGWAVERRLGPRRPRGPHRPPIEKRPAPASGLISEGMTDDRARKKLDAAVKSAAQGGRRGPRAERRDAGAHRRTQHGQRAQGHGLL